MTGECRPLFPSLDLAAELADEIWPLEPLGVRFEGGREASAKVLVYAVGEVCEAGPVGSVPYVDSIGLIV